MGERYGEIRTGGKVLQPWRGSGGNRNVHITFAYLICWWVSCATDLWKIRLKFGGLRV